MTILDLNNGIIKHTNTKKNKKTFNNIDCSINCKEHYCYKVAHFESTQECVNIELGKKKMQKQCKDNENNRNNANDKKIHYFNQCALKSNNINTLFNGLNILLINVEYYKSDINNTNIFNIDAMDAKLSGILNMNPDNSVVLNFFSLLQILAFIKTHIIHIS